MGENIGLRSGRGLSGNALKLLAAVAMTVDHIGYFLLPQVALLRYVGRLAMPVFAFMVGETCRYTHSRVRYLLQLTVLAAVCQAAYTLATGDFLLCVPVSFVLGASIAICLLQLQQQWRALWAVTGLGLVAAVCGLHALVGIDYGVAGCLIPAASVLYCRDHRLRLVPVAACLLLTALEMGLWQLCSLAAIPLLLVYSGRRGRLSIKYFFYIFYPAHLAVIQLLKIWLFA